jgi:hypothetical protein
MVAVTNTMQAGPPRVDPNAETFTPAPDPAAAVATPGAPAAPAAAPAPVRKYIVGEELIDATLRIEIIDFVEPATK